MVEKFIGKRLYPLRNFSKGALTGDSKGITIPKQAIDQFPEIEKISWKVTVSEKIITYRSGTQPGVLNVKNSMDV